MAIPSQGTILEIAGAGGGAKNVSAIAVGYPTILTSAAHGLKRGDVVTLSDFTGAHAADLNGKVVVIQYVTTGTVAVGINTTGRTINGNGKITAATWTGVGEIVDMDRAGGTRSEIDVSHLESTSKEFLAGLRDSGSYTFSMNWLFGDAGQAAVLAAEGSDDPATFKVTYPSNDTLTFDGYVTSVSGPSLGVDDKLSGSVTIRISGDLTWAA